LVIGGLLFVVLLTRRWSRKGTQEPASATATTSSVSTVDEDYLARVEREIGE